MNAIEKINNKLAFYQNLNSFAKELFGFEAHLIQKKVYIFGYCDLGFQIANALRHSNVQIAGYLDNNKNKLGSMHEGNECLAAEQICDERSNCYVVIAVTANIEAVEYQMMNLGLDLNDIFLKRNCRERLGDDFFNYLTNCIVGCLAWGSSALLELKIQKDQEIINETYERLADELSKEIYISRIALALDGERYCPLALFLNQYSDTVVENRAKYGKSFYGPRPSPEFRYYFNQKFMNLSEGEVYVDIGAEDGNTIIPFIERMSELKKSYSKIYGFEPDPFVFPVLERTIGNFARVALLEKAVGEVVGRIGFVPSEMNLSSRVCGYRKDDAEYSVPSVSLDSYFHHEKYTLVKIDPHGESIKAALQGGRNTIRKYVPQIIAGAYHSIENLYMIPRIIWEINPEYRIFLRHLAFHANETHAFAVPTKQLH